LTLNEMARQFGGAVRDEAWEEDQRQDADARRHNRIECATHANSPECMPEFTVHRQPTPIKPPPAAPIETPKPALKPRKPKPAPAEPAQPEPPPPAAAGLQAAVTALVKAHSLGAVLEAAWEASAALHPRREAGRQ
jgi:hypothetical protein